MSAVLALAPRLRRAGGRESRLTTALAVAVFAVMTALTLSVVGGLLGFAGRAADPADAFQREYGNSYVVFASTEVVLLVVPLLTLGGSAARLGVARRDARLATLRPLGVTPREVVALTVFDTAWQELAGAVAGVAGYLALLPVWTRAPFQGSTFSAGSCGWAGPCLRPRASSCRCWPSGAASSRCAGSSCRRSGSPDARPRRGYGPCAPCWRWRRWARSWS